MSLLNFLLATGLLAINSGRFSGLPSHDGSILPVNDGKGNARYRLQEIRPIEGRMRPHGGYVTCRRKRHEVCGFTDIVDTWGIRYLFPPDYPGPYPPNAYKDPSTGLIAVDKVEIETDSDDEGEYTEIHF